MSLKLFQLVFSCLFPGSSVFSFSLFSLSSSSGPAPKRQATFQVTSYGKVSKEELPTETVQRAFFLFLRATAGACKIEYLLQTCARSAITDELVATCSAHMRAAYASILREHTVDDLRWTHATLPQRKGGYGLRDPSRIVDTARLASLVIVSERAASLGASNSHIRLQTSSQIYCPHASSRKHSQTRCTVLP